MSPLATSFEPSSPEPLAASAPPPYFELLACPRCRAALRWSTGTLDCPDCRRSFPTLPGCGAPVLLPADDRSYDDQAVARERKEHVRQHFAAIDTSLAEPFATFATFLNLGYVSDGSPEHAIRGPARPVFAPASVKLLFEVVGPCVLDDRVLVEVGSGRGGNLAMLVRHYSPRAFLGIDLSETHVELCARRHRFDHGGFVLGDAEHLPLADGVADVVLNLESSHYYPDIPRFLGEVRRVLAPGGELLWSDLLPVEDFEQGRETLDTLGFEPLRDQDISDNVLLSCEAIAEIRNAQRHHGLYQTFKVIPGSHEFEALRRGETRYRILHLRCPDEARGGGLCNG